MSAYPNSIIFITGTFISNRCWDEWIEHFQNKGYTCIAPAWPHKDASAEELRNRSANDPIALNILSSLTDHFAGLIKALPEKPILIGHSLGGLIVQILLQRELGSVGVAMHSFPPSGVSSLRLTFRKAVWEAMALFSSTKETYLMPFATWRYAIVNGMDYEQQKDLYYRYAVPESKQIIREAFKCISILDFKKPHPPLLLTSGSMDKLIPTPLNYFIYKKYAADDSVIDYKEFQGHNHLIFGNPAWKKEADYILHWLRELN